MIPQFVLLRRAAILSTVVLVTSVFGAYAQQTPEATRRIPAGPRRQVPTAPPLPIDQQTPPPGMSSPAAAARALPPLPSYAQWKRMRFTKSASGGTVCVTYAANNGCAPSSATQIVAQGSAITWQAQTLPNATLNNYQDYQMDPDVTAPAAVGAAYTGPTGLARAVTASKTGVYVFGTLNIARNQWDALAYMLVGSKTDVETYSDSALTSPAQLFTAGSAVYINAAALTPTDSYVFGVENTSVTGACVFTFPASAQPANKPCNLGSGTVTGANAPGGNFFATWNTQAALSAGAYSVTLFDQTTGKRLAQQQIAIVGSAETVGLTFDATFNSPTLPLTKTGVSRVAYNGPAPYTDANAPTVSLTANGSGLANNTKYYVTVSDPNGQVVQSTANATTNNAGALTLNNFFTFNNQQSPQYFGPNTYTFALINKNVSNNPPTVMAVRTLQVLGYTADVAWSNGTIATNLSGTPGSLNMGVTYTNDGEAHFGRGNADPIYELESLSFTGGGDRFPYTTWQDPTGTSACTFFFSSSCIQKTVLDSNLRSFSVQLICFGGAAQCSGTNVGGGARTYFLLAISNSAAYGLPPAGTLTVPNLTFQNATGDTCSACGFQTLVYPLDGEFLSASGASSTIANNIELLSSPASTYNLQADLSVYGTVSGGTYVTNRLVQGNTQSTAYLPRFNHALYAAGQPRATTVSPIKQVLALHLVNASSLSTQDITQIAVSFPAAFNVSNAAVDANSPSWTKFACVAPAPLTNTVCLQRSGSALSPAGRVTGVHSDTVFLDVDPPSGSFTPTTVSVTVLNTPTYGATPTGSNVAVASGTPATVGPMDLAAYSLNSSLMTGAAVPGTVGQSTGAPRSQTVGLQFQNTPSSSDVNPDSVDAVLLAVDPQSTTNVGLTSLPSSWTTNPSTWTLLSSWQPTGPTGISYFLFGLCAAQNDQTAIPTAANLWGLSLTSCTGAPSESSDSLLPSGIFTAQTTVNVGAGTGTVTGKIYAHGSNGNGWSNGVAYTLNVTNTDAATGGFTKVNGAAVATGAQPTVGGDPSSTTGSAYEYTFTNSGNTNITKINLKIPGPDISGASDQEVTGPYFLLTDNGATIKTNLAYTGSGGTLTQCTLATVTQPTNAGSPITTTPGSLVLTGCSIPPNYSVVIKFHAKSPATANSTYQFSSTFDGSSAGVAAAENWFADQQLKITVSATMTITLKPTSPTPSGTGTPAFACAYSLGGAGTANLTSFLDFGTVASGATETCTDAIMISLATNIGGASGWDLYVTADGNPSNVVQFLVDSARSSTGNNVTYSNTAYTPVGTGSPGQLLAARASGNASSRTPYDIITSWKVTPVDAISHTQNLTFTFVAN